LKKLGASVFSKLPIAEMENRHQQLQPHDCENSVPSKLGRAVFRWSKQPASRFKLAQLPFITHGAAAMPDGQGGMGRAWAARFGRGIKFLLRAIL
jgi:hypothetical protein